MQMGRSTNRILARYWQPIRTFAGVALLMLLVVSAWPLYGARAQDDAEVALPSVEVKAIHFNLIRQNRIEAAISVDLVLLLNDPADVEDIYARLPQIRADFLQGLLALAKVRFRIDQPIDIDLIRRYLQPIAARRLGKKRVQIFVENAVITPHKS